MWGRDFFLYSQHWQPAAVALLAGLGLLSPRFRIPVFAYLMVLIVAEFICNAALVAQILSALRAGAQSAA